MRDVHSYSSLSTLASCCQKYDYAYNHRLATPSSSIPQFFGGVMHEGLAVLYKGGWDASRLPEALDVLRESWGDFRLPFGAKQDWITLGYAELRLRCYVEEREASPTDLELDEVVTPFTEELHTFDWHHPEHGLVRVKGLPDLVLKSKGKVWVVDHKTATSQPYGVGSYYFLRHSLGHQLRIYAAMYQNLTGEVVSGGIINALACGKHSIDPPEKWKTRTTKPSALNPIPFTQEQIDDAHIWARGLVEIERACEASGLWPRNELGCDDFGGCEFIDLCTAPSELARRSRMMTAYKRREER